MATFISSSNTLEIRLTSPDLLFRQKPESSIFNALDNDLDTGFRRWEEFVQGLLSVELDCKFFQMYSTKNRGNKMKATKSLLAVTVLSIGLLNLGSANAAIINIDSGNGSGIGVSLSAGDHVVSWIGIADGGAYDAWSAWSGGDNWLNYILVTTSAGQVEHGTGAAPWYATPTDALAAAQSAMFHLSLASAETVNFMVADNLFYDNRGGVSLSVTDAPVPVPAAAWLLGSGLLGLIGVARHKAI